MNTLRVFSQTLRMPALLVGVLGVACIICAFNFGIEKRKSMIQDTASSEALTTLTAPNEMDANFLADPVYRVAIESLTAPQ